MNKQSHKQIRPNYFTFTITFALVLAATLSFCKAGYVAINHDERMKARLTAENYAARLSQEVKEAISLSEHLEFVVKIKHGQQLQIKQIGPELIRQLPFASSVQFVPNSVVTQICPLKGNEKGLVDLWHDKDRGPVVRYGAKHDVVTIQGPFELFQGGTGMAVRNPVFLKQGGKRKLWGFTIVIVNTDQLFKKSRTSMSKNGYDYRLTKQLTPLTKKYSVIAKSKGKLSKPVKITFTSDDKQDKWQLEVAPKAGWTAGKKFFWILSFVIVIEALFFMLIWNFFKIKALQLEATIDPLTKVYNRTGFEAALKSWIKKHPDQPFTLLMIDVDDFKFFNDYYGHQVGDEVLTWIGNMLARSQNSGLLACRYGGDEFCAAILGKSAQAAEATIKQIHDSGHGFKSRGKKISYSLSIGYADYPLLAMSMTDLLAKADEALYAVKMDHKDGVKCYGQGQHHDIRSQIGFTVHDLIMSTPTPLIVFEAKKGGNTLFVNQSCMRLLGYQNIWQFFNVIRSNPFAFILEADLPWVVEWLRLYIEDGRKNETRELRLRLITAEGQRAKVKAQARMTDSLKYGQVMYVSFEDWQQA